MRGYIILKANSESEAECLSSKVNGQKFGDKILVKTKSVEQIENIKNLCGVRFAYYCFEFNNIDSLANYVERTRSSKEINFKVLDGSEEDLYRLVESFLKITKEAKVTEIDPKEVFEVIPLGNKFYLVQYALEGPGGNCKRKGKASVFVDGTPESYALFYALFVAGYDIDAYLPSLPKVEMMKVLYSLSSLLTSCSDRSVNVLICSEEKGCDESIKVEEGAQIYTVKEQLSKFGMLYIPPEIIEPIKNYIVKNYHIRTPKASETNICCNLNYLKKFENIQSIDLHVLINKIYESVK